MKTSNETIEKFQKKYFEEFQGEILKEEEYEKFLRFINLLKIIPRPTLEKGQDAENPDPVQFAATH
jgi:hypothetical protein